MVAVPVRGTGCILKKLKVHTEDTAVAVPVRGAGCIALHVVVRVHRLVAVPVRGAGCIHRDRRACALVQLLSP